MRGSDYLHKDLSFSEKEIQNFLLTTNNKEIMDNVKKARKAKRMQFIGFPGIPLGIAGLFALSSATSYNSVGKSQIDGGMIALSGLSSAAAITCPTSAGILEKQKK